MRKNKIIDIVLFCFIVLVFPKTAKSQDSLGWEQLPPIIENLRTLTGLYFFNKDSGWVCGSYRPSSTFQFAASTTNGGATWKEYYDISILRLLFDVFFVNDSIGFCIDNFINKTTDGGNTWRRTYYVPGARVTSRIEFSDEKYGWAIGGDSTIVKTTDGGETWQIVEIEGLLSPLINGLSVIDSLNVVINTLKSVHKTTDGGESWTVIRTIDNFFQDFNDVKFVSKKRGWIVGALGTILLTNDGGSTWYDQSFNWNDESFQNIDALDSLTALAVTNYGAVYRTDDGGNNWIEQVPREIFPFLTTVQIVDKKSAYAVGSNGTIIKTTNGGITWVDGNKNDEHPKYYRLYQAYPNPFNPTTKIKFELPVTAFVNITIYNSLGQKVQTLLKENMNAGSHELVFNARDLASGVYIYRLRTNSYVKSRKMLLLR